MGRFECGRCGMCCKVTMSDGPDGNRFGMYLDTEERKLFPEELVRPLFGVGDPVCVIAWQLGVDRCPNYQEKDGVGSCAVYDRRPRVCRAFPVTSRSTVSNHCPAVRAVPDGIDPESIRAELEAHDEKILQALDRPRPEWVMGANKVYWTRIGVDL